MTTAAMQDHLNSVLTHARKHGWRGKTPTLTMKLCATLLHEADRRGEALTSMLRDVGVHRSMFDRWRSGATTPSFRVLERFEDAGIIKVLP